jgi:predicted PurR-regulated permease PerM
MEKGPGSMTDQSGVHRGTRLLIIGATCVIIIWGLNQAQSVVVLFLVSGFLAVIGTVPVLWMERKGVPSIAAVLIVMAALVTLMLSIGVVVGASLNDFSNTMPFYQARLHDMLLSLKPMLAKKGIVVTDKILLGYLNPAALMGYTATLFTALSNALSNSVVILFTVLFVLLEAAGFPAKLRAILNNPKAVFPQYTGFVNDIKRYMVIKTLINLAAGVLTTLWLVILGVDYPVMWGFLAFLLHFVPSLGSVVAAIPAVLLALLQFGPGAAVLTGGGYLVIGMVIGNIIEPKIMGSRLGLSPLVVFVSLILWGSMLGVVGALLCVPLTMTLKLACEENEETQWIAVLLGPEITHVASPRLSRKAKI